MSLSLATREKETTVLTWYDRILDFVRDLLRFAIAGTAVTVVQSTTYIAFVDLGWSGPVVAGVVAFLAGTVVSFAVHYRWTFRSTRRVPNAAWRFGVARLAGLAVNTGGIALVTEVLALSHYWGLAVMLLVTPLTVFTISKYWAFHDVDRHGRVRER